MRRFIVLAALLAAPFVIADAGIVVIDAGSITLEVSGGLTDAGLVVAELTDAGGSVDAGITALELDAGVVPAVVFVSIDGGVAVLRDAPIDAAKNFYLATKTGNGWLVAMFLLFFLVGLLRTGGKWLHRLIPDDTQNVVLKPIEKVFGFLFDTKIGGWLLNWLSAIGGCLATAHAAGVPVDAGAWKVAFLASTGGTALIELKDDLLEWWEVRQVAAEVKAQAEKDAKAVVVASPAEVPSTTPKAE